MSKLDGIKVRVEQAADPRWATENTLPLLHEIHHALKRLLETGETRTIDLRSLPMGSADEAKLLDTLGVGEVEANIQAMGNSVLRETRYPGVWFIEHFNADERLLSRLIDITFIPTLLCSQPEDVRQGLAQLTAYLQSEADA
jgi:hydrogenase-1 operon protein HyaF